MEKKIILIFLVLLFAVGIAFGEDNNTTESVEIDDSVNYILPISITNEGIKFDDGFIGFCIDPSKGNIETSDKFTLGVLGDSEIENNIKLAIIECYRQGKEDAMADILSEIDDKNSNNEVLKAVFNSDEKIGDIAVVNIDDSTEATFEFEFLKSSDDAKSDCVAYKVSMKTVQKEEPLTAANDDDANESENTDATAGNGKILASGNEKELGEVKSTEKVEAEQTDEPTDAQKATATDDQKAEDKNTGNNDTTTNETNKTIVNKTNTVIVNENNTTIINHNNVKEINDTAPKEDNAQDLLKAGNPILILVIVIVVIVLAVVVMRRKD